MVNKYKNVKKAYHFLKKSQLKLLSTRSQFKSIMFYMDVLMEVETFVEIQKI